MEKHFLVVSIFGQKRGVFWKIFVADFNENFRDFNTLRTNRDWRRSIIWYNVSRYLIPFRCWKSHARDFCIFRFWWNSDQRTISGTVQFWPILTKIGPFLTKFNPFLVKMTHLESKMNLSKMNNSPIVTTMISAVQIGHEQLDNNTVSVQFEPEPTYPPQVPCLPLILIPFNLYSHPCFIVLPSNHYDS